MHKPGGSHVPSASADTVLPPPHGSWNPPFICPPDCLHRSDLRVTETELRGARAQLQDAFDQLSSTRVKLEDTQASV